MHILLVEDDALNRKVIRTLFEGMDVTLVEAQDGQEALDALEVAAFDVVLMDLRMPGMDGFEATQKIRAREDFKANVPLVVITADTAVNISGSCKSMGADAVLFKPVRMDDLFGAIGDAIAARTSTERRAG